MKLFLLSVCLLKTHQLSYKRISSACVLALNKLFFFHLKDLFIVDERLRFWLTIAENQHRLESLDRTPLLFK